MKRALSVILLLALALSLASCSDTVEHTHCEMTLTLPKEFRSVPDGEPFIIEDSGGTPVIFTTSNEGGADLSLCDGRVAVTLTRISHEAAMEEGIFPGLTQLEFAKFYMGLSEIDAEVELHSTVPFCAYEKSGSDGGSFTFLLSFFQTPYAYFVLSFIVTSDNYGALKPTLLEYISSVGFG